MAPGLIEIGGSVFERLTLKEPDDDQMMGFHFESARGFVVNLFT